MSPSVSRLVRADPAAAWDVLARTAAWPDWGPSVSGVDPVDAVVTPGLTGRVRTPVGLWLPFRVTSAEVGRSWSWSVAGVPATGHTITAEPGGCRIAFTVPWAAAPYLAVCRAALGRLATLLEAREQPEDRT